jgi:hypothetical protein
MFGLNDEINGLRDDINDLKTVIATLLPYAPADARKLAIMALEAKGLLPEGVKNATT